VSAGERPAAVRESVALARYATARTGGAAELFARAGSSQELAELLAWAAAERVEVSIVGSGSNLLIADDGVAGLVLKLDGELAAIEIDGREAECGGGARLPKVAALTAAAGLAGLEFGVNIPGTVGGAVRMNANAYGGQLGEVLEWAEVVTAAGSQRRSPAQLGFAYRSSALGAGEIVARARFCLLRSDPQSVKAALAELRARRHEDQPQGIKTFGSTFKNPQDARAEGRTAGLLLAEAGCAGLQVGRARFSLKHANFVENTGGASTAEIVALMAEGRRRVAERFGVWLEPEVQTLGVVRFPWER